jgi:CRISPR-associated endonuclease Cas2
MGEMEEKSKQRTRRYTIQKVILQTVAAAGVLSIAILAPNAFQALRMFGFGKGKRYTERINNSRTRLVENGLLEYTQKGLLKLTPKGEAKLRQLELCEYKIKKPRQWDKKWRLLIFDIKEERRPLRDKIRRTLTVIGFIRLQDSVWVYPYDCEDLVTLLKADFKIGKDVLYIIADTIENDSWLKKQFVIS